MGFVDYLRMLLGWHSATSDTPALSGNYRVVASQAIVPGSVASQSRVAVVAQQGIVAGSVASESR